MNLKPFREYLVDYLTDVPVFMYRMPDTVTKGVLLLHNLNGAKLDPYLPGMKRAKFQAIVRSGDFESGYDLGIEIINAFKVAVGVSIGYVHIHFVQPLHDPVAFPISKGQFVEFSVNFETVYLETT